MSGPQPLQPQERFWRFITVDDGMGECWEWGGGRFETGYAAFWDGKRNAKAHRWAYEHFIGPVPAGLDLDHLCRNRACVNPAHLEPVSRSENLRRSPLVSTAARKRALRNRSWMREIGRRGGARRAQREDPTPTERAEASGSHGS